DADEHWVVRLAESLGLPCQVGRAEAAQEQSGSLEDQARRARYDFLQRAAEAAGVRYVATAHTADDQVETILHHLLRGTGLAGLAGMNRSRQLGPAVTLLRPLLAVGRAEVLEYLSGLGQTFRT